MKPVFRNAWGYQGDAMNLPVENVDAAIPFYRDILGFALVSRSELTHASAVLGRADIEIGLAENGGDPTQDGCAFEVDDVQAAFAEFKANGLEKEISDLVSRRIKMGLGKFSTSLHRTASATGLVNASRYKTCP